MAEDIFKAAESAAEKGSAKKAYWTGVISVNLPELEINNSDFHLKAAKSDTEISKDQGFYYIDRRTQRRIFKKESIVYYRYNESPDGKERTDVTEITYNEAKQKVRYDGTQKVTAKQEKRWFDEEKYGQGVFEIIPDGNEMLVQDGDSGPEEIEKFITTKRAEVGRTIPLNRLNEMAIESIYMLGANLNDKVNESSGRVRDLADSLLKNNVALYVEGFVLRSGLTVHDAVIFPHRVEADEKMWLLMAITKGVLKLDANWAVEVHDDKPASLPVVKKAPRIKRS